MDSKAKKRIRGWLAYLAYLAAATAGVLLLFECILRVFFGLPEGRFHIRPLDGSSLYYPSSTIQMYIGPIPYTIETNSLGFRGPEITQEKPEGVTRVVALGDSVTDGFYVDNEDTYPYQLEQFLRKAGYNVEVVNTARGGATIDRELAIFNRFGAPLQPDIVVLTFVSNDIDDIRGIPREELIQSEAAWEEKDSDSKAMLLASTALGELLLDRSLRARYRNYRRFNREANEHATTDYYNIPGNTDYASNLQAFTAKTRDTDGILLYDQFDQAQRETIDNYLFALEHLRDRCQEAGAQLVFVYTPGYNQIHDPDSSLLLPDLLRQGCERLAIPFVDLTPPFREAVKEKPVILAPLDFHPNPHGNRVIAEEVAGFLQERVLSDVPAP